MTMRTIVASILTVVVFSLSSCYKDVDEVISNDPAADTMWVSNVLSTHAVSKLKDSLRVSNLTNTVDLSVTDTIIVGKDLQVVLPGKAWMTSEGKDFSGLASVDAQLFLKPGAMLRNGVDTRCGEWPLGVGGVAYVAVRNGTDTLQLKSGYQLQLIFTLGDNGTSRTLFTGQSSVQWDSLSSGSVETGTMDVSGTYNKAYVVRAGQTGWLMCGSLLTASAGTGKVNVLMPSFYTNANTLVYCILPESHAALAFTGDYLNQMFTLKYVPLNTSIKIITLSVIDGQYYWGTLTTKLTGDLETFIKPSSQSLSSIVSSIMNL